MLPVQLANLAKKLPSDAKVGLLLGDSSSLGVESGAYDQALLFFLLHEQPEAVRRKTLDEALRVIKPGGRLVIVDYHRPAGSNPLFWPMKVVLSTLEPFALDLWEQELAEWLPESAIHFKTEKLLSFGGLYQLVTVAKSQR